MKRDDLIEHIRDLIDSGEIVSIEGYRYSQRLSRSGAVKKLADRDVWARIEIGKGVFYVKK